MLSLTRRTLVFSAFFAASGACARSKNPLVVFAAASLKPALDEILILWETRTGIPATVSYAGSGALARQIEHGAPIDIFLSANAIWMDSLAAAGLLKDGLRRDVASNGLVIVAPAEQAAPLVLDDLPIRLGDGRLAMGLRDAVPAGIYGQAALKTLGLWELVKDRLAETDSVMAALALVSRGEVPLGLVYASDALASDAVEVVAELPSSSHPTIRYPTAMIAESVHPDAEDLFRFLTGADAAILLERAGFLPAPPA